MPSFLRWFFLVLACTTLMACASPQAGWRDGYAASPGYYDSDSTYGYGYDRPPPRSPCQCRDDRYSDYRDGNYPYRN